MTASVKPIRPVHAACASVRVRQCVFVHLNCGVCPRSFPRTIDIPTSPHPAFYMCPKIHYHLVAVDMPLTMKMHFCPTRTENTTAHNIPSSRCDYHRFSFFPRTVQEWNTLPEHVVSLTTIKAFKNAIITAWSWTLGTPLYCTVYGVEPLPRGAGQ